MSDLENKSVTCRIHVLAAAEIENMRRAMENEERRRISFVQASKKFSEVSVHGNTPLPEALRRAGRWKL